jgi:cytochrome P450
MNRTVEHDASDSLANCIDIGPIADPSGSQSDPLVFLKNLTQSHGDCVRYQGPYGQYTLFNKPHYVRQIMRSQDFGREGLLRFVFGDTLLTTHGGFWRHRRTLMQPFFLRERVASAGEMISCVVDSTNDRWTSIAKLGGQIDVAIEMHRLTLDVIMRALFSKELTEKQNEVMGNAVTSILNDLANIQSAITGYHPTVSSERNKRFKHSISLIDEILYEMIDERQRAPSPPNDLLTHLINAEDEQGRRLTRQEIRNEAIMLLASGHETTAMSLSWAWYLLSRHADAEDRLLREVDDVLNGHRVGVDDLAKLHWTEVVLKETLRMYPAIWIIVRRAIKDTQIAGVDIPNGDSVISCIYLLHRHADYWKSPDTFLPERYSEPTKQSPMDDAYLPFGQSHHMCIGMHLAMLELQMALAALAKRFRIRPISDSVIEPFAGVTLRMQGGFPAALELR